MFTLRSVVFSLMLAFFSGPAIAAEEWLAGPIAARVERVIDGDTIAVRARIWLDQELVVHVRLAEVDAPETYRPECDAERAQGEAAHAFVADLLAQGGGEVVLSQVRHGKYAGRVVADVTLNDGRDVGGALLSAGLATFDDLDGPWCASSAAPGATDDQRASR